MKPSWRWIDARTLEVRGIKFSAESAKADELREWAGLITLEGSAFDLLDNARRSYSGGHGDFAGDAYETAKGIVAGWLKARARYHEQLMNAGAFLGSSFLTTIGDRLSELEKIVRAWIDHPEFGTEPPPKKKPSEAKPDGR